MSKQLLGCVLLMLSFSAGGMAQSAHPSVREGVRCYHNSNAEWGLEIKAIAPDQSFTVAFAGKGEAIIFHCRSVISEGPPPSSLYPVAECSGGREFERKLDTTSTSTTIATRAPGLKSTSEQARLRFDYGGFLNMLTAELYPVGGTDAGEKDFFSCGESVAR